MTRRRALLALPPLAWLAAGPGRALAQDAPLPSDPAAAPPAPPVLDRPEAAAAGPRALSMPSVPLAGLEGLPDGGWRLRFPPGSATLPAAAAGPLGQLGRRLAERPRGRFVVLAQVSGPESDTSVARRLSLARALAVKQALAAGGLAETRIDLRPMGRTEEALDAVDVLPPESRRAKAR